MENVVFANGFEDHIEGLKVYPPKVTSSGETNLRFYFVAMVWSYDPKLDYSSLTPEIMDK